MKNFKYIISILFVALIAGCSDDSSGDVSFADNAAAPTNITALFTIAGDNSGTVTIAPHGEGVTSFEINYGDGTAEPGSLLAGEKINHVYPEGTFTVIVTGIGINGKRTDAEFPLTVSFVAPENLAVNIATVVGSPLQVNVSATADLETYFQVWFGEDPSAEPVTFNEGDVVPYTYSNVGTYTVTVTAFSGGAASATYTQEVIISNPLNLPIDFESANLNYAFTTFGGATASVVNNPASGGINTSAKVGSSTPANGQMWTGAYLTLDAPINMAQHFFKIKVWSPAAGVTVLLKLENLNDGGISAERPAVTTVANQWEELVYDFTGANASYSKVVLFFNAGANGNGDTYYFDDIVQASAGVALGLPLNFESSAAITWNNFGGAVGTKVANPNVGGINTSAQVGRVLKTAGSQTWAGVAIPFDAPIDFSVMKKIKMKVWSPAAGITLLMKFENMNPHVLGDDIERTTTTTLANQWEEVTFDFTGINNAKNYQQIVLFFNFNVAGTGETYYFDDVRQSN
ncbi:hypothetical protein ACLI09_11930 [Flavobacterium sp. RHBU_24]|uniref:hypothetical protein n=1 Tax=Flavobacterium sp. RHBU_24 TaxID=3391185 RepID=UPI003984C710